MKRILAALLLVSLAACGSPQRDDTQPWDNHADIVTASGVVIAPGTDIYIKPIDIELAYQDIAQCFGFYPVMAPTVWFRSFKEMRLGAGWDVTVIVQGVIIVNTDHYADAPRSAYTDKETLRHAFVHHFLNFTGLSYTDNAMHNSQWFTTCAALGPAVHN